MKALSVKQKITLWYTGLIVAVLSVIFAAVLFAADDVLLLNLQDKLENEVYGNASSLELRRDGTLSLDELDFLHDGVMLAVYNNDGTLIAGLNPVQMPDTPFRSELLQTVTNGSQTWYVFDLQLRPARLENSIWLRGSTSPLSDINTAHCLWRLPDNKKSLSSRKADYCRRRTHWKRQRFITAH